MCCASSELFPNCFLPSVSDCLFFITHLEIGAHLEDRQAKEGDIRRGSVCVCGPSTASWTQCQLLLQPERSVTSTVWDLIFSSFVLVAAIEIGQIGLSYVGPLARGEEFSFASICCSVCTSTGQDLFGTGSEPTGSALIAGFGVGGFCWRSVGSFCGSKKSKGFVGRSSKFSGRRRRAIPTGLGKTLIRSLLHPWRGGLTESDIAQSESLPAPLGSVWNQAGTWEDKSLNSWALERVKELLQSADTILFPQGSASLTEVSSCTGDATLVTVRKKKRVFYNFDICLKFNGELQSRVEMKNLEGTLKVIEATYGDLDDLQVEVSLEKKSVPADERSRVSDAIGKSFLPILRAKLEEFEAELKER